MQRQEIIEMIGSMFGVDAADIKLDDSFTEDLNADSTDIVELRLQLQDSLQTKIDSEEFAQVDTVEDCITLIEDITGEIIE